jgi:antitoxin component YwqK of YwqJK toxin-antitoxin module
MKRVPFFIIAIYVLGCETKTEKVYSTYEDGKPKIIFIYQNEFDSLNFQKKMLYNSGKINYSGQFVEGKKSGTWTWWHENGNKKEQCKYKAGSYIDTVYHWYESGQIQQIEILSDKKIAGNDCSSCNRTTLIYFESGKLKEKFTANGGSLNGPYLNFEENGAWDLATYRNDSLNGSTIEHEIDSTGRVVIIVGQYNKNRETGLWRWFDKDSVLFQSMTYRNGKTFGTAKTYYPNGKTEKEGFIDDGKYNGAVNYYDDKGKLLNIKHYKDGVSVDN